VNKFHFARLLFVRTGTIAELSEIAGFRGAGVSPAAFEME